jgi:hypothetical protein
MTHEPTFNKVEFNFNAQDMPDLAWETALIEGFKNLLLTTTIGKRIGVAETIQVKARDLHPRYLAGVFAAHGFQRKINDSVGGDDISPETKVALAKEMVKEFLDGTWAPGRAPKTEEDRMRDARRAAVLFVADSETKKGLAKLEDKGVAKLDEAWAARASYPEEIKAEIERKYAELMAPKVPPKVKLTLSI